MRTALLPRHGHDHGRGHGHVLIYVLYILYDMSSCGATVSCLHHTKHLSTDTDTTLYSALQCCTVLYSAEQCATLLYSLVQCRSVDVHYYPSFPLAASTVHTHPNL